MKCPGRNHRHRASSGPFNPIRIASNGPSPNPDCTRHAFCERFASGRWTSPGRLQSEFDMITIYSASVKAASRNSLRGSTAMASKKKTKQTRKAAATASSRVLKNPNSTEAAKTAAASALSQTGRAARTGEEAASSAGRALAQNATSPRGRKAAGSALSQAPRKKRTKSS
jgi:hypothetical protein